MPEFLEPAPELQENRFETRAAAHSNYKDMTALMGADGNVYLGKKENYHFISSIQMPWHKQGQEYSNEPSYYDNSDNSLIFVSDNEKMFSFISGDGWVISQANMINEGYFTEAEYKEFERVQSEVFNDLPYKDNFTGIKFDGKPFEPQQDITPDNFLTGEKIETPRGSFSLTDMTAEQMKATGYGFHHSSDDGKYNIMGSGTRAFAVANEHNPIAAAEMSEEQNYNMIDGIPNNRPTVDELEKQVNAGETISLYDLAEAIKTDKAAAERDSDKKPSIREQLKAAKEAERSKPPQDNVKKLIDDLEV